MANTEIRNAILKHRIRHYEVASQMNISESTFSRWLRKELPLEKKQEVLKAINDLIAR